MQSQCAIREQDHMSTKESYISTGIALLPVPHNTLLLLVILRVRAHGKVEVLGRHCNVRPITGFEDVKTRVANAGAIFA